MNKVAAAYPQNSQPVVIEAAQESDEHVAATNRGIAKENGRCWGGRIRTSDWLIQSSVNEKGRQTSVLTAPRLRKAKLCKCSCHLKVGTGPWRFGWTQEQGCSICTDWRVTTEEAVRWHNGRIIERYETRDGGQVVS